MTERAKPQLAPGQAIMFLGDHTSPDDPGYLRVISDVLSRFHPQLQPNLISAGSNRQTASGLKSRALFDLLTTSRPDWLVINVGLADALREPELPGLVQQYKARLASTEDDFDETLGPVHLVREAALGPHSDGGSLLQIRWSRIAPFYNDLLTAVHELGNAGVRCVLMTTIVAGNDTQHPSNLALRAYSRAIREAAAVEETPVVDLERAFKDVLDRAGNYKQKVALADEAGVANPQGQALIARTFLSTFGLLPGKEKG